MTQMLQVAGREIRMGFRNPWAYSFLTLFALFMLALLLINRQGYVQGYSGVTGTMLNLILYLLPLMTLMLGSFSLTGEKEDGGWELLSTYPLTTGAYLIGKYIGLAVVLLAIAAFGFGLAGVAGWAAGGGFGFRTYVVLLAFSFCLALMYLAVSQLVGALARNRWQALTISAAVWFFTVMAWPALLIAVLGMLPYPWIKPGVSVLTLFNPAELARLLAVIKLGGGSMLGADYTEWVTWIRGGSGTMVFTVVCLAWVAVCLGLAGWLWERGRRHG